MAKFILGRMFATIPVMIVVSITVFLLLRLTPGDPAVVIAGDNATPEQLEAIRLQMGLQKPLHTQFLIWSGSLLRGDLGTSIITGKPVLQLILDRMEPTVSLAVMTIVLATLLAVPLGVFAASRRGAAVDRIVIAFCVVGFSVPVFVIGYVLIKVFALDLRWVPVQGFQSLSQGLGPFFERMVLPTLALTLLYMALIARIARASILDVLSEDYIRTARAKGLREVRVLIHHALRNAAVPIITIIGIGFTLLIGGVVVTESVFNLPGIGRLTIEAVITRDYPVIQAVILLSSLVYMLVNLAIDMAYAWLDPRIRY